MNIDYSLAPPDTTHYLVQEGTEYFYWFLDENDTWMVPVRINNEGKHNAQPKVKITAKERKNYLNGMYHLTHFELVINLENE